MAKRTGNTGRKGIRWNESLVARLGTVTDRELADELGISRHAVLRQRASRGIKAHGRPFGQAQFERSLAWRTRARSLLGTMPDQAIAASFGVSKPAVCLWRRKLGIPSYRSTLFGPKSN